MQDSGRQLHNSSPAEASVNGIHAEGAIDGNPAEGAMDGIPALGTLEELKAVVSQHPGVTLDTIGETPVISMEGFRLPGIRAGFSTRLGGVSEGIYESMNLAIRRGDEDDKVFENYRRLSEALGVDWRRISGLDQVHKTEVLVVEEADAGEGVLRVREKLGYDAQITNVPGLPLVVFAADCVPILYADPVRNVVGSAHAGWRGAVAGIAAVTVRKMSEVYGSDPADIRVMIGPSAGPEGYEVDDTVAEEAGKHPVKQEDILRPSEQEAHWYLDLWRLNREILIGAGVREENIFCTGLSTLEYPGLFFSHRRAHGRRGLGVGIIALT